MRTITGYIEFKTREEAEAYRIALQGHHDATLNTDKSQPYIRDEVAELNGIFYCTVWDSDYPDPGAGIFRPVNYFMNEEANG